MPIFVEQVMLVGVLWLSRQTMVPFLHEKHLASKVGKVGVILEHGIELFIRLFP